MLVPLDPDQFKSLVAGALLARTANWDDKTLGLDGGDWCMQDESMPKRRCLWSPDLRPARGVQAFRQFADALWALAGLDESEPFPGRQGRELNRYLPEWGSLQTGDRSRLHRWLAENGRPLGPQGQGLDALAAELGDYSAVVLLGQATQGTHEDQALKSGLVLQLSRAQHFRVLAFQISPQAGQRLQAFVAKGSVERDAQQALREAGVPAELQWHEVAELLLAVQTFNATTQRPIDLIGIDWGSALQELPSLLTRLKASAPELIQRLDVAGLARLDVEGRWTNEPHTLVEAAAQLESALVGTADHSLAQAASKVLSVWGQLAAGERRGAKAALDAAREAEWEELRARAEPRAGVMVWVSSSLTELERRWRLRDMGRSLGVRSLQFSYARARWLARERVDGECAGPWHEWSARAVQGWLGEALTLRDRPGSYWIEGLPHDEPWAYWFLRFPLVDGFAELCLSSTRIQSAGSHLNPSALWPRLPVLVHIDKLTPAKPLSP